MSNMLFFGDNLDILRQGYFPDSSVDLIYLDPPFNSRLEYNLLFERPKQGRTSSAQAGAFQDTWSWDEESELAYRDIMKAGGPLARLVDAMRSAFGESNIMAYIVMMGVRLRELHIKLKPSGSLYLHCDPTASHYLKLVLDQIFGPPRFLSEVIWKRTSAHSSAKRYGPVHDTILEWCVTSLACSNGKRPRCVSSSAFTGLPERCGRRQQQQGLRTPFMALCRSSKSSQSRSGSQEPRLLCRRLSTCRLPPCLD